MLAPACQLRTASPAARRPGPTLPSGITLTLSAKFGCGSPRAKSAASPLSAEYRNNRPGSESLAALTGKVALSRTAPTTPNSNCLITEHPPDMSKPPVCTAQRARLYISLQGGVFLRFLGARARYQPARPS